MPIYLLLASILPNHCTTAGPYPGCWDFTMQPDLPHTVRIARTAKIEKLHGTQGGLIHWSYGYVPLVILEHRRHRNSFGFPRPPHFGLGSLGLSVQAIPAIPIMLMLRAFGEGLGTRLPTSIYVCVIKITNTFPSQRWCALALDPRATVEHPNTGNAQLLRSKRSFRERKARINNRLLKKRSRNLRK